MESNLPQYDDSRLATEKRKAYLRRMQTAYEYSYEYAET